MQKLEISDIEENFDNEGKDIPETEMQNEIEKPLDPRAGRVNVELPQIPFNAAKIAELLSTYKFHPSSTAKSRRQLLKLFDEYIFYQSTNYKLHLFVVLKKFTFFRFMELSQGRMPLGIKRIRKPNRQRKEMDSRKAALRLIQFEKGLFFDKMNKKRKKEKNGKVVCDKVSINNLKNENTSDLESDTIDPKSKLTDTTAIAKADLQDVDTNTVPFKKRKRSDSMCDVPSTKSEIIKSKKKLCTETSKKSKTAKIKLNQKNKKSMADKNVERKIKKMVTYEAQISNNTDQHTSISPISNKKIPLGEIKKSAAKKESKLKSKITSLKNVNTNIIYVYILSFN